MPEVHLPHLDEHDEAPAKPSGKFKLPKLLLEVILISSGVFLGLAGEQWRESAHKHELAENALRGFRSEMETNRKAIADVADYHVARKKELKEYFDADVKARAKVGVHLTKGIQTVAFEHAAWDLALATGSLADIDQQLAYSLAHLYNSQSFYAQLTQGMTQAMYLRPPMENEAGFLGSLDVLYGDLVYYEPLLIAAYDQLIPKVDRLLKE